MSEQDVNGNTYLILKVCKNNCYCDMKFTHSWHVKASSGCSVSIVT